ncbi:MAG: phosphoglucosamine mutase [Thermoplasmata archaeon]|nr:phosphoglucosamine mutase [Thermoplasmata archaeon]
MGSRMFGTNGVRGVANEDMCCELALGMGRAVGAILGRRIAVASDPRTSSQMLKGALCAGLMSVGVDVVDLGMIPTPALQHYIRVRGDLDGGVMITASHNPPEFNGIKCVAGDGTECTKEQEDAIEAAYRTGVPTVGWHGIGTLTTEDGAADEYIESVIAGVDADAIRSANLKVVLDCANGCACATSPALLERLGVSAVVINGEPDMRDPAHLSEPTEDNLGELLEEVRNTGADLGIAHDGDADRCVFVTSDGRYVPGDLALAILGRYLVSRNGGGKVVITVATSMVVEDTVGAVGGETVYTAVGSPIVAREMAADGAVFGGEENGGLIFASHQFCRDGAMGLASMLECVVRAGPLSEQLSELPSYTTVKKAVKCPEEFKDRITEEIASNHPDAKVDRTDGLKLLFDDGWVLLRPSGTEPKYRIYSESRDANAAEKRSSEFVDEFEKTLGKLR